MAQITKNLDQVDVWDEWYADMLGQFVEEAKEKGIEIGQAAYGKYTQPAISFSGFWSQGDGLAFDADINWPAFFDAHPELKEQQLNWYLLLSANPEYFYTCVRRKGRNDLWMQADVSWDDYPDKVEHGFFAGLDVEDELPELYSAALEAAVLSICEDEASRMYKALEAEYERQLEDAKEREIEYLIEVNAMHLHTILWPMMTGGEVEDDRIDYDDLEMLGLIDRNGITKKGLKVLA